MTTNEILYQKYGHPHSSTFQSKWLMLWQVPDHLRVGRIPRRIYCHKDLIPHLEKAFTLLIERNLVSELHTWDGCYILRPVRGYEAKYKAADEAGHYEQAMGYLSIHSWAMAVDVNAKENGLGKKPILSPAFVQCFVDAGFEWGGGWARPDGMHFQLKVQ